MDSHFSASMRGRMMNMAMPAEILSSSSSSSPRPSSPMSFAPCVEECKDSERPPKLNEKFLAILDQLDTRVEKYRKDAWALQDKRDFLVMFMDLLKNNDHLNGIPDSEREEIFSYLHRVNSRLCTVELQVRTVRDQSQEDSLNKINNFIDTMLTIGDPVMSRQRCQEYLNACCSTHEAASAGDSTDWADVDVGPVDKRFESVLLGCTLDDQKTIKKRLVALMGYLNKRTIHN